MTLERLEVHRVRNIISAELPLAPGLNLIYGENGSGKTSLLESAYFLSSARSHRSNLIEAMVQRGEHDCLVVGEKRWNSRKMIIGVSRGKGGARDIRINGETVNRASELVKLLPTLVLGPESVSLLLGPPAFRRRFLNWGVFHVEHRFGTLWEDANRVLKQRNLLLRNHQRKGSGQELESWTYQLVQAAEKIDDLRSNYISDYEQVFLPLAGELAGLTDVRFRYVRGWDDDQSLAEVYARDLKNDQIRGFTQKGFQRADVRISVNGQPAEQVCSRGELKSLVWAMILAQGITAEQDQSLNTLYLIDDVASELDANHRRFVMQYLVRSGAQVLVTGVDQQLLTEAIGQFPVRMFHVEHGRVALERP